MGRAILGQLGFLIAFPLLNCSQLIAKPILFKAPVKKLHAKSGLHVKWELADGRPRLEFASSSAVKDTLVEFDDKSGSLLLARKVYVPKEKELSFKHSKQKVTLYTRGLESIYLDGDASFDGKEMEGEKISLHGISQSSLLLHGNFQHVVILGSESSDIVVSGHCANTLKATLDGTSTLNASKLKAFGVEAHLSGATVGYFWSDRRLNIMTDEVSEAIITGKGKLQRVGQHKPNIVRL